MKKQKNSTDLAMIIFAVCFIVVGSVAVIHPEEIDIGRQSYRYSKSAFIEHVSKRRAEIYGGMAVLFGSGTLFIILKSKSVK